MLHQLVISDGRLEEIYFKVTTLLVEEEYNRAETVAALLAVVAIQTLGYAPPLEELARFVKEASGFTALFFGHGKEGEVVN